MSQAGKPARNSRYHRSQLAALAFDDVLRDFTADQRIRNLSPATIHVYERSLRRLQRHLLGGQPDAVLRMKDITHEKVVAYLEQRLGQDTTYADHPYRPPREKGVSPHTVHQEVRSMKTFGAWLKRNGYDNPFADIRPPKLPKHLIDVLTEVEIDRLANCHNPNTIQGSRWQAMFAFAIETGVRVGELVSLRLDWLDLDNFRAKVRGKGNKERWVRFGNKTQRSLSRYINLFRSKEKGAETVFVSLAGDPLTNDGAQNILKHVRRRTGITRLHWHLLRHTFATHFLLDGGDGFELKELLGHESMDMTDRYVHLAQQLGMGRSMVFRRPSLLDKMNVDLSARGRPRVKRRQADNSAKPG